jgi:hypothetical protein
MIIATRELIAICKSGGRKPVTIRIESPVEEEGTWRCGYQMQWPEDGWPAQTIRSFAPGADALHAVQMGLMKLGAELHFSSYHREGKLYWHEGQVGYGIIVHKSARDLLRGEDAEMLG